MKLSGYPRKGRTFRFLPPPYLEALGNIAAYYAYLENAIEVTMWAFLKLDYHDGTALTTEMGTVSRIQALTILANRHLAAKKYEEVLPRFLEILAAVDAARVRRNQYIHAMWKHEKRRDAPHIESLKRSAKGAVKHTQNKVTIKEMRDLAQEIDWLTMGLMGFVEAIFPDAYSPFSPSIENN